MGKVQDYLDSQLPHDQAIRLGNKLGQEWSQLNARTTIACVRTTQAYHVVSAQNNLTHVNQNEVLFQPGIRAFIKRLWAVLTGKPALLKQTLLPIQTIRYGTYQVHLKQFTLANQGKNYILMAGYDPATDCLYVNER